MGDVRLCAKRDCGIIRCSIKSHTYGFICYECFGDLKDVGPCDPAVWLDKPKHMFNNSKAWSGFLSEEYENVYEG